MDLSSLKAAEGSVHSDNFRRGRGHGSGNGKTAGKGHKGQKGSFWSTKTRVRRWPDAIIQKITKERFQVQKL